MRKIGRPRGGALICFGLAVALGLSACGSPAPAVAVLYATGSGARETLWGQAIGPGGPRPAIPLGRLGPVPQWGMACPWQQGVAVAMGSRVVWWGGGRPRTLVTAPPGKRLSMVFAWGRRLWVVLTSRRAPDGPMELAPWNGRGFDAGLRLPPGILAAAAGRVGGGWSAAVLWVGSHAGRVWFHPVGAATDRWVAGPRLSGGAPAVSVAVVGDRALVPFAAGRRFGIWDIGPTTVRVQWAPSPERAVTAVVGLPSGVWGVTPAGLEPWEGQGFAAGRLIPWRWSPPTPPTAWPGPRGWLFLGDGAAQGMWFDPGRDRFVAREGRTLPAGAVGRAVLPLG